eukprot:scaffold2200_cov413-Prasinococcus_capsulatus_cf.AAC.37
MNVIVEMPSWGENAQPHGYARLRDAVHRVALQYSSSCFVRELSTGDNPWVASQDKGGFTVAIAGKAGGLGHLRRLMANVCVMYRQRHRRGGYAWGCTGRDVPGRASGQHGLRGQVLCWAPPAHDLVFFVCAMDTSGILGSQCSSR